MRAQLWRTLGPELCRAFGLDENQTKSIDLHVAVNERTTLTAVIYVTDEQGARAEKALQMVEPDDRWQRNEVQHGT